MIAHLRGELVTAGADWVVIDVAGVGYRCLVPASTRSRLPGQGAAVQLYTYLQVREDALTLYGFLTQAEYDLFELLLRVDGVGPKVALAVLSTTDPAAFRRAVALEDLDAICRVPGIGRKTAQRLVLELKDKIGAVPAGGGGGSDGLPVAVAPAGDAWAEVSEALIALGYSRGEAAAALARVRAEAGEAPSVETLVRLALKQLYRG
ncbi:Holliday junction branch migration protein RuvA [Symbiobacterium thermophilum]|uniref:Holliday junction branch migration complex subunit RuvA n=1 Tax=Symbiobacterium thermophilum TaxID=2734 RepID=A0A953IE76_SYMTR|nr:Holliday junction branch migration protein RuvA [Symbiobacterium thermophilum]MBY6277719.1 Holliday junction branch migration protein RuvA [Symbiobacterium thermophilum]